MNKQKTKTEQPLEMWADNEGRLWYYNENSEVVYVD